MKKNELKEHKKYPKTLSEMPVFKAIKSQKLPPPLHKIKSSRIFSTKMLDVSDKHLALFYWKNGELFTDSSFYGFLFLKCTATDLYPLMEYHWHPSHKGQHIKTPCRAPVDYTNRNLPMAREINRCTDTSLDPRTEGGRVQLVFEFCKACGISMINKDTSPQQPEIWN